MLLAMLPFANSNIVMAVMYRFLAGDQFLGLSTLASLNSTISSPLVSSRSESGLGLNAIFERARCNEFMVLKWWIRDWKHDIWEDWYHIYHNSGVKCSIYLLHTLVGRPWSWTSLLSFFSSPLTRNNIIRGAEQWAVFPSRCIRLSISSLTYVWYRSVLWVVLKLPQRIIDRCSWFPY